MSAEGDHIKVTASKYPFPTVCADNQSTDWFHSISRTLKWNERERQKSFVVVEEGPTKEKSKKHSKLSQSTVASDTYAAKKSPDSVEEEFGEEEEEDEVSDEDEEEDKFDIDDSSPEAQPTTAIGNRQTKGEEALGMQKAKELAESEGSYVAEAAASALHEGNAYMRSVKSKSKSRSRSRTRQPGTHSGVDTPGRFASTAPHPPAVSPRHVEFSDLTPLSPSASSDSLAPAHPAQRGARDDINNINTPRGGHSSSKSRIPRDRDIDAESMNLKTPTMAEMMHSRKGLNRGHAPEEDHHHHRRAFAVWGHDESSDSNASDSDADA